MNHLRLLSFYIFIFLFILSNAGCSDPNKTTSNETSMIMNPVLGGSSTQTDPLMAGTTVDLLIDNSQASGVTANDSFTEETTAGETTAGETTAGETTAGETTAGETTAGIESTNEAAGSMHAGSSIHDMDPEHTPMNDLNERRVAGLPLIHDYSSADPEHINQLIRRALNGLGLNSDTGPHIQDRIFVGRWYIAWIDETGFYGKMNGLWPLDGDLTLPQFILLEGDRPVNAFIVGENGRGEWPSGYMGSEHIEFPNHVPEEDDSPDCVDQFCAQYAHAEALQYTNERIPTWRACNATSPLWSEHFSPWSIQGESDGITIWYEGPLTKQGDFGGSSAGNHCGEDYLFADGQRRRVFLRVGYKLSANAHSIDRIVQVRNPAGHPEFDGPMSFIGGFVMTQWPQPHPLKELNHFIHITDHPVEIQWNNDPIQLVPNQWNQLPSSIPTHDVVLGWANQHVTLSPYNAFTRGQSYSIINEGEVSGDNGFCLCIVHGAIEIGGGLLNQGVAGGTLSPVATRRLTIHHEDVRPMQNEWIYEAEGSDLQHQVGRLDRDAWSATTDLDERGYMIYGPYVQAWGHGTFVANFRVMIDVADQREERVVTLDIFDTTSDEILASQDIFRHEFLVSLTYQDFELSFDLSGRAGHIIETRVFWHDISYVKVDKIVISD